MAGNTNYDWNDLDLPNDVIKGCIAISGLFDLSPLKLSWLQTEINLTEKITLEQSPLLEESLNFPSTMLIVEGEC